MPAQQWIEADRMPQGGRETVTSDLESRYAELWQGHPPDSWGKTERVIEYGDAPFLVRYDEEGEVIAYDLSYRLSPDRLSELEAMSGTGYPEDVHTLTQQLADWEIDMVAVYHLVVHPEYQGFGIGLQAPTLRQTRLETEWATEPPANVYERIRGERFQPETASGRRSPDIVLSFVRQEESGEEATVHEISRGFGFVDTGVVYTDRGIDYSLMAKTAPRSLDINEFLSR